MTFPGERSSCHHPEVFHSEPQRPVQNEVVGRLLRLLHVRICDDSRHRIKAAGSQELDRVPDASAIGSTNGPLEGHGPVTIEVGCS